MVEREEEEAVQELDDHHPHTKLEKGRNFGLGIVYGAILGSICAAILDVMLLMFYFFPGPSPTPPLDFNLHSFNLSSSSSSSSSTLLFSVRNPLHVSLARASLSCTPPHRLLATGFVKIREASKHQRMRSMKVVCKDFEVLFSLDFTAATLAGGPNKCVQSWGDIY